MLFDAAFAGKLSVLVPVVGRRRAVLRESIDLERAYAAYRGDRLCGICGFHHLGRSFTGGLGARSFFRHLGFLGGLRACVVGALLVRKPAEGELLLDGVAVAAENRGGGIGSALLAALKEFASHHGYHHIRLDVVDSNPRAQALYQRHGFVTATRRETSLLTRGMGFAAVTTMRCPLRQPKAND